MAPRPLGTYRTGLMVGYERGYLDFINGQRQETTQLWVPAGVSDDYCRGLAAGYLKGVTGESLADEQLGRGS